MTPNGLGITAQTLDNLVNGSGHFDRGGGPYFQGVRIKAKDTPFAYYSQEMWLEYEFCESNRKQVKRDVSAQNGFRSSDARRFLVYRKSTGAIS